MIFFITNSFDPFLPQQFQYSYFTQAQYEFGFNLQLLEWLPSSCKHLEPYI